MLVMWRILPGRRWCLLFSFLLNINVRMMSRSEACAADNVDNVGHGFGIICTFNFHSNNNTAGCGELSLVYNSVVGHHDKMTMSNKRCVS